MSYAKHETMKKQKKLVSKSQRNGRKLLVNVFKIILVLIVASVIACAGAGFGMMKGILDNVPDASNINIMPKGFKSVIYRADGSVEKELATTNSNREYVYYEDIPEDFVNAFVAIEDERFWSHNGIDVRGILRAAVKGVASGNFNEGASTLTQQLIKNHVFNVGLGESTFLDKLERKIQEQYLALELEKKYKKEEIVEYYLNTIYLGRGANGIQAAANKYFDRDIDKLTISEIAAIAGITQNPTAYDPVVYPETSAKRRKLVLNKMLELKYITQAQYDEAINDDVYDRIARVSVIQKATAAVNTYYEDAILNQLTTDFMNIYECTKEEASTLIYTGGYSIYSVQDMKIQEICDNVINNPSYIGSSSKVSLDYEVTISTGSGEVVNLGTGHILNYYAAITGNSKYNNIYTNEDAARAAVDEFLRVKLEELGDGSKVKAERFSVSPQPQFSCTVMDQKTGYVKGIVGGRGPKTTDRSWNRATDTKRQPGSTFKVLAAYVPLIDTDLGCLAYPFDDSAFNYANGVGVRNWYGGYWGYNTVRKAIAQSMNIIAVKAITRVTPQVAYEYLLKEGFTTIVDQEIDSNGNVMSDITQSTALGGLTKGITNLEITAAYASIANGGIYTKPVFYSKVVDHDGKVVIDNTQPTTHEAMRATTAWQLIQAMKDVVNAGTGGAARMTCGVQCAGKTGTTSNNFDLWFCGMTPYYTASVWMGYDSNVDLGGGSAHKYMWRDIMDQIALMEGQDTSAEIMPRPEGITTIELCQITGKHPLEDCPTFTDYCATSFRAETCEGHETVKLCVESKCVATNACPETVAFVVDTDENGNKYFVDGDDYPYTEDICELHPEEPEEDETKATISTSAGEGGTITGSLTVDKGSSVTIYITPYDGYAIADVLVNGVSVGAVSSYTFTSVMDNATVQAVFTPVGGVDPGEPQEPVDPIEPNQKHWFSSTVRSIWKNLWAKR